MPRTDIASPGTRDTTVTSAARTTNSNTGTLTGWGAATTLRAQLDVTAASGTTPTLNATIEDSLDAGTTWNTIGTFAQKITAGREVINVTTPFTDTIRITWTIGGTTPSFTFSVNIYSE